MARALLAIAFVFCLPSLASPQSPARGGGAAAPAETPSDRRPTVGGFWSTNLSTAALPPGLGQIIRRGWSGAGAAVDVPFGAGWSLDARVMWNRKGARLQRGVDGFQEMSAHYLSAPVLLKVKTGAGTRPYVAGGIEVSRLLSATTRVKLGREEFTESSTADLETWDAAVVIAGGIERRAGPGILFGGVLYSHGLRNVFADSSDVDWAKTRTLTALAGIRF